MRRTQYLLLTAAAYVAAHGLGYYFVSRAHWVSPVWPASGVGLAALLLAPAGQRRATLAVLGAATLLSNLAQSGSPAMSAGFTISNLLEFGVGAWLLRERTEPSRPARRTAAVLRLTLVATLWTSVPALIGAATGSLGRDVPFGRNFLTWWIADALGILLVTPPILSWARREPVPGTARGWEVALLVFAWGVAVWFAFFPGFEGPLVPQPYMLLPLLAWTALRLSERTVTLALVAIAGLAVFSTLRSAAALDKGLQAFIDKLVTTQVYVAVAAVQSLLLAASTTDAKLLERAAREDEARVRRAEAETRSHAESLRLALDTTRRAEAELSTSEALLRNFIRHTPAAVAMFDTEMRYLEVAERWLSDYQLQGQNLIGRSHYEVFPDIPARWRATHERALAGEVQRSEEDPFERADGSVEWLQWETRPWLKSNGEIGGVVMFTQVITERKRAQEAENALREQLRRTQKLEALGTLAGGIAHDFNNILGAMLAFTELAKLENADRPGLQGQLREITAAGKRATHLVQQILSFSRQQRQERKPIALVPVIHEALTLLRSTLPSSLELTVSLPGSLPSISADATQIHQVTMNLCTNAAQAMGGRGRLSVALDTIELGSPEPESSVGLAAGQYVRLTVSDTGHGMDASVVERIFEPFFTTKQPGGGTGLGLAVVHGIVKDHEGAISVASEPGKGTTFTILFPVCAPLEAPGVEVRAPEAPHGSGQKVMFVDDERALCEAARLILRRAGYDAVAHRDSSEAWRELQTNPDGYALVVTDLTMPGMTGLDLAAKIHGLRPELPIILTSGHPGELASKALESIGVRELLQKPVDYAVLTQAVARAIPSPGHTVTPDPVP
jgi:PAS domain S-box-containing protein